MRKSSTKDRQKKEINEMSKEDESAGSWVCWQGKQLEWKNFKGIHSDDQDTQYIV